MNPPASFPLVCVVIPNKNGLAHLAYSLPPLLATDYPAFKAVLVEDRSSDGSADFVREKFPSVLVLENKAKRGFAATVNVGVRHALEQQAEFVAVFNSDIKVPAWWLKQAVAVFRENGAAGIVGFREVLRREGEGEFAPNPPAELRYAGSESLNGFLFVVRASVFRELGLLDEDYFMYGEDNDLVCRVLKAGYTILTADVPVWHYGEGASSKNRFLPAWLTYRNAIRFSLKNSGFTGAARMAAALFYHGCLPHFDGDLTDPSLKRQRRYAPPVNFFLLAGSLGWNLLNLPATLRARRAPAPARPAGGKRGGLRIAMLNLTGGGMSGGYVRYLESMLPRLSASEEVESILCASPKSSLVDRKMPGLKNIVFSDCRPVLPFKHFPEPELKRALENFRPDVIFVPTSRHIQFRRVPVVTMIQNMAPLTPYGKYPLIESLKMIGLRLETKYAVRKAAQVIAMSGFVRDFLLSKWGVAAEKISLIYFGAPPPSKDITRPAAVPEGSAGKFFFTAGSLEPYRGAEDILLAVAALKRQGNPIKLYVAGAGRKVVSGYEARLHKIVEDGGIGDCVTWLGPLSRPEMEWCYKNCTAFIMASRVEALALVCLEALVHACPCIGGAPPPLPEAFGEAALYYPYADHEKLAGRMREILAAGPELRAALAGKSRAQAEKFSWDRAASETLKVMRKAASAGR